MGMFQSLSGQVKAELTSADFTGMMAILGANNIAIRGIERPDELTARFQLRRRDYGKVRELARKRGDSLRVLRRQGIYWDLKRLTTRPILAATFLLLLLMTLILPGRVLFVEVEGNDLVPSKQILEAAEASGIRFWASRR